MRSQISSSSSSALPLNVRSALGRPSTHAEASWKVRRTCSRASICRGLIAGFLALTRILTIRPDVVVSLGGPEAWMVGFVAFLTRVPHVVVEPNVMPGGTARNLAHMARLVFTAFRVPHHYLRPDKCAPSAPCCPVPLAAQCRLLWPCLLLFMRWHAQVHARIRVGTAPAFAGHVKPTHPDTGRACAEPAWWVCR